MKAAPPSPGPWEVPRTALLSRLKAAAGKTLITVAAPAGYGKSTILRQWVAQEDRPAAWLTLDRADNDPAVLFAYLVAALAEHGPMDTIAMPGPGADPNLIITSVVPRVAATLDDWPTQVVIVLDSAEHVVDVTSRDALAEFLRRAPRNVQVAIASRSSLDLHVTRLVLTDDIVQLGPDDVSMDEQEVARLIARIAGIELDREQARRVAAIAEGWPAGITLIALAMKRVGHEAVLKDLEDHGSQAVSRYLRAEILDVVPRSHRELLRRTSILDRLTPALCAEVADEPRSARILEELADAHAFVQRVGEEGWYRAHTLLREALRRELGARDDSDIAELHRRAAGWFAANGLPMRAVEHALDAGDEAMAAQLIGRAYVPMHYSGRVATLHEWIGRFPQEGLWRAPWLGILATWLAALQGDVATVARLRGPLMEVEYSGPMPDGSASFESARALLVAAMVLGGLEQARGAADRAAILEGESTAWGPVALLQVTLTQLASGEREAALAGVVAAAEAARVHASWGVLMGAKSLEAFLRIDDDHALAARLATEAWAVAQQAHIQDYATTATARAILALAYARKGQAAEARDWLTGAQVLRANLSAALPIMSLLPLIALARGHAAVGDEAGAWTAVRQADAILSEHESLVALKAQLSDLRRQLREVSVGGIGSFTLTAAELRVLQFLPTHLSFPEIAQRLHVSHSTVKAQARSIYSKLEATTRTEAVSSALRYGLLDPALRSLAHLSVGPSGDVEDRT